MWDPYIEDFKMLARSVAILTADLTRDRSFADEAELFHLLMQEYVEPVSCARKTGISVGRTANGEVFTFPGEVGISDRVLLNEIEKGKQSDVLCAAKRSHRIIIHDEDGIIYGELSFSDDSLYYVVNPLIGDRHDGIGVNLIPQLLHLNRRDLNYAGKLDVSIEIEISDEATFNIPINGDKIKSIITV